MNISAQVIDTIVEWIDDNLHQPLCIDDIARHAGYSKWHLKRLFLQYKGKVSVARHIRERKLAAGSARPCEIPTSGFDICLKYGFDSQTRPVSLPVLSISRRARIAKRTTAARTGSASRIPVPLSAGFLLSCGLICQREPAAPYPAQYQILNDSQR